MKQRERTVMSASIDETHKDKTNETNKTEKEEKKKEEDEKQIQFVIDINFNQ